MPLVSRLEISESKPAKAKDEVHAMDDTDSSNDSVPGLMGAKIAKQAFQTGDFAIDEYRPMKVVCIGAGFSGIIAGIRYVEWSPERSNLEVDLLILGSPSIVLHKEYQI